MTGAEAIIQSIIEEGVSVVFGKTGHHITPLLQELGKGRLQYTMLHRGESVCHMAMGYGRISGSLAVCLLPSGCSSAVTAIASAYHDQVPLLVLAGQVPSKTMGQDSPYETDLAGCCGNYLKQSYLVKQAEDLPKVIKEACFLATTGRTGPVVVEVPVDFQIQDIGSFLYPEEVEVLGYEPRVKESEYQMKRAITLFSRAKKPVLCIGTGVSAYRAESAVQEFIEKYQIPVLYTQNAVSVLPSSHPQNLGLLGCGGQAAIQAMEDCDLLISVGESLEAYAKLPELKYVTEILSLDVTAQYSSFPQVLPLVGNIARLLEDITSAVPAPVEAPRGTLLQELRQEEFLRPYNHPQGIHPVNFFRLLGRKIPENAIVAVDTGSVLWDTGSFLYLKENHSYLSTSNLAVKGFALPSGIGAKIAEPHRQTFIIVGDGGFQECFQELSTILAERLDLKIIVMQNRLLGDCHKEQLAQLDTHGTPVGTLLVGSPDFLTLAHAYGFPAGRISQDNEMEIALQYFLEEQGTQILIVDLSHFWANPYGYPVEEQQEEPQSNHEEYTEDTTEQVQEEYTEQYPEQEQYSEQSQEQYAEQYPNENPQTEEDNT